MCGDQRISTLQNCAPFPVFFLPEKQDFLENNTGEHIFYPLKQHTKIRVCSLLLTLRITDTMYKKRLFLWLFSLLSLPLFSQQSGIRFTEASALRTSDLHTAGKDLILVYFHADGCKPCRMFEENAARDPELGDLVNRHFQNYSVNLSTPGGEALGKSLGVTVRPAFVFLDETHVIVHRLVGYFEKDSFLAHTRRALSPDSNLHALQNRYPAHKADHRYMELYVRSLQAANTLNAEVLADAFAAFPSAEYGELSFVRFFLDFVLYRGQVQQDFHSASFSYFAEHPEKLYGASDSVTVSCLLSYIAQTRLEQASAERDSSTYLACKKVLEQHWSQNQCRLRGTDYSMLFTQYHQPLQNEMYYQYHFRKDEAACRQAADRLFQAAQDEVWTLFQFAESSSLRDTAGTPYLEFRLRCAERGLQLGEERQYMLTMKAAAEYLLGRKDDAIRTFSAIDPATLNENTYRFNVYRELEQKLK